MGEFLSWYGMWAVLDWLRSPYGVTFVMSVVTTIASALGRITAGRIWRERLLIVIITATGIAIVTVAIGLTQRTESWPAPVIFLSACIVAIVVSVLNHRRATRDRPSLPQSASHSKLTVPQNVTPLELVDEFETLVAEFYHQIRDAVRQRSPEAAQPLPQLARTFERLIAKNESRIDSLTHAQLTLVLSGMQMGLDALTRYLRERAVDPPVAAETLAMLHGKAESGVSAVRNYRQALTIRFREIRDEHARSRP